MNQLRVLFHAHVCPDCGSDDITESEVETGDGITEIALTCHLRHRVAGGLRRGLEHPAMTGQLGVIYMLHFDQPYKHARHYVGWTADLLDRLDQHATGHGARLVAVIWQAGIGFTLIRICEGTRRTERAIKNDGGAVRFCPACTPRPWNGHWHPSPAT